MERYFKIVINFFLFPFVISCTNSNQNTTKINGNISNLPNGTLYLYSGIPSNRIDSTQTKDGVFEITHKWNENCEGLYLGIDHVDKDGVLRAFDFPTNAKYKNENWNSQFFMNDSLITINGKISEFIPKNLKLSAKYKLVNSPKILSGKQTCTLYNIDADLFEKINNNTIKIIKEKIDKYPYSYHLLYKINENKNTFSATQVKDFLNLFKGEITQSKTYKNLSAYNDKRFNKKNIALPLLEDNNGIKKEIIDRKYKNHLIIFWASWCGPCKQEIPLLKKIFDSNGNETEFISISIDTDKLSWQKALKKENMYWKQLIISNKLNENEALQIYFKLNQAIPYTVLVDNNLKILGTSTGLSNEKELEKFINK